jgi:predicted alpha-1,2-mannosidase
MRGLPTRAFALALVVAGCTSPRPASTGITLPSAAEERGVDKVDPFIGTAGEGNTYPGVSMPFGFVQPGPDTGPGSGAAGYKFDRRIRSISQQHLSGMGGPLFGQLSLMPATGPAATPWQVEASGKSAEAASPGTYTVTLAPWRAKVELTATQHVAWHRHTHAPGAAAQLHIDAGHVLYGTGANWGSARAVGGDLQVDAAAREISGHMVYQGGRSSSRRWQVHFVIQLDQTPAAVATWGDADGGSLQAGQTQARGSRLGAVLSFAEPVRQVTSRVAVSYRSIAQARSYLAAELPTTGTLPVFDAVRAAARETWAQALSAITVEGGSADQRRQFATALYRLHLTPNDWRGEAPPGYGDGPYIENILCLWDTFRTVNPLLTLIRPELQRDIVNTLIAHHRVKGWTGDAHSAWELEHVQNGSNADVVIADAYVKQLPGVDWPSAYAAIRKNAFEDADPQAAYRPQRGRFRLNDYVQLGYVPADASATYRDTQSVSRTLEYAHNDFSVLTLAHAFGSAEDVAALQRRAGNYRQAFDAGSGFMRGRNRDGSWHSPFDPLKAETGRHYYEGHAWTWSWYAPHDAQGLIALHGGREAFVTKLNTAVSQHYEAYNEPAMLMSYQFIDAGRPDLTQFHIRRALRLFSSRPDGLPGNDDSATTSAWLLWALMGLYPNAGQDWYYIGSPSFIKTTMRLADGRRFVIESPQASAERMYVAGATLNGRPLQQAWLRHTDIAQGGRLVLHMQERPSSWGTLHPPPSMSAPLAAWMPAAGPAPSVPQQRP